MADLAHENGALLMVDNTFTTPIAIRPMDFGADIVINSLTKFLNGHSDAMGGSVTTSQELCDRIQPLAMLLGTPGDPFSSWLIQRGVSTASVRLPRQMHNAEQLGGCHWHAIRTYPKSIIPACRTIHRKSWLTACLERTAAAPCSVSSSRRIWKKLMPS